MVIHGRILKNNQITTFQSFKFKLKARRKLHKKVTFPLCNLPHGIKGFVIPTKSSVEIEITKIFCYNKMFSSINKTFGCCSKILVAATKNYLLCLILLP